MMQTCNCFDKILFSFFRSFGSFLDDLPVLLPCTKTTTEPLISDSYINSIFTVYFLTVFKWKISRDWRVVKQAAVYVQMYFRSARELLITETQGFYSKQLGAFLTQRIDG